LVADRLIHLGRMPVLSPMGFGIKMLRVDVPTDPCIEVILEQNLKGERCSIQEYKEITEFTNGKDHTIHTWAKYRDICLSFTKSVITNASCLRVKTHPVCLVITCMTFTMMMFMLKAGQTRINQGSFQVLFG
jgi:hypothetical protein